MPSVQELKLHTAHNTGKFSNKLYQPTPPFPPLDAPLQSLKGPHIHMLKINVPCIFTLAPACILISIIFVFGEPSLSFSICDWFSKQVLFCRLSTIPFRIYRCALMVWKWCLLSIGSYPSKAFPCAHANFINSWINGKINKLRSYSRWQQIVFFCIACIRVDQVFLLV